MTSRKEKFFPSIIIKTYLAIRGITLSSVISKILEYAVLIVVCLFLLIVGFLTYAKQHIKEICISCRDAIFATQKAILKIMERPLYVFMILKRLLIQLKYSVLILLENNYLFKAGNEKGWRMIKAWYENPILAEWKLMKIGTLFLVNYHSILIVSCYLLYSHYVQYFMCFYMYAILRRQC